MSETTPTEPTELVISVKTAEAVVNYLATKPYIEVYQLVALMQQLKPFPVPEAKSKPMPLPVMYSVENEQEPAKEAKE